MFTIFTLLIFIAVVAILLFFSGSLLKNGKVQSIFIGCSVALFTLCILFSHDWFGPSQSTREYYSGHYKIEVTGLKYPSKVIYQNVNLTLIVKKDLTFELDKAGPFFKTLTGTWTYESGSAGSLETGETPQQGFRLFPVTLPHGLVQ